MLDAAALLQFQNDRDHYRPDDGMNARRRSGSGLTLTKMQTLAQVNAKADYTFDPSRVAVKRPSTLWRVARCISLWDFVEAHYAQALAFSLKADPQVAMDMYLAITNAGAQSAALKSALRTLPPQYRELFEAIWSLGKPLATERHKV